MADMNNTTNTNKTTITTKLAAAGGIASIALLGFALIGGIAASADAIKEHIHESALQLAKDTETPEQKEIRHVNERILREAHAIEAETKAKIEADEKAKLAEEEAKIAKEAEEDKARLFRVEAICRDLSGDLSQVKKLLTTSKPKSSSKAKLEDDLPTDALKDMKVLME